jgi:hypothetical protein
VAPVTTLCSPPQKFCLVTTRSRSLPMVIRDSATLLKCSSACQLMVLLAALKSDCPSTRLTHHFRNCRLYAVELTKRYLPYARRYGRTLADEPARASRRARPGSLEWLPVQLPTGVRAINLQEFSAMKRRKVLGSAFSPVRFATHFLPKYGHYSGNLGQDARIFSAVQTGWQNRVDSNPQYNSDRPSPACSAE